MKHDDKTLQAAIDAAMLEIGEQVYAKNFAACPKYYRSAWPEEADDRLALAKAFLAKLPAGLQASEADKALADLASRLANIAYDPVQPMAFAKAVADHVDDLREDINHAQKVSLPEPEPILADDGRSLGQVAKQARLRALARNGPGAKCEEAATQAVANVVLAQAIRRMEAVPVEEVAEIIRRQWLDRGGWIEPAAQAVRARLITAARGEPVAALTKLKSFLKP